MGNRQRVYRTICVLESDIPADPEQAFNAQRSLSRGRPDRHVMHAWLIGESAMAEWKFRNTFPAIIGNNKIDCDARNALTK